MHFLPSFVKVVEVLVTFLLFTMDSRILGSLGFLSEDFLVDLDTVEDTFFSEVF